MLEKRKIFLSVFMLLFAFSAQAAVPQDALSLKPESSVYGVFNVGDIGQLGRDIFSPANIKLIMPLLDEKATKSLQLVAGILSQVPSQELSLIAGTDVGLNSFLQLSVALPSASQPKLKLMAEGKATTEDIISLLLGDGALLMAAAFNPEQKEAAFGSYYSIEDKVVVAAKDNLVIFALSSDDLGKSLAALEQPDKRLSLKRSYQNRNFFYLHLDFPTLIAISKAQVEQEKKDSTNKAEEIDLKTIEAMFKAPLNIEYDISSLPEKVRFAMAANVKEAVTGEYLKRLESVSPVQGGSLVMLGSGKPLFAWGAQIGSVKSSDLKFYPKVSEIWQSFSSKLQKMGISGKDVDDLFSGSISFACGGTATVMGAKAPGFYLALTGKNGSASKILTKVTEDEEFSKSVTFAPLNVDGWDKMFKVDPAICPVPVVFGIRGEMLFLGLQDMESLSASPELTPKVKELLGQSSLSTLFIDIEAIWAWLQQTCNNPPEILVPFFAMVPPPVMNSIKSVLEGVPSVPFVRLYGPAIETALMDFFTVDVSEDKRILPKAVQAALELKKMYEPPVAVSSLEILMNAKDVLENRLKEDSKVDLAEVQKSFMERVTFLEKDGVIYCGTLADGASKEELTTKAGELGLLGSAALTMIPGKEPYSGQEAVWMAVKR